MQTPIINTLLLGAASLAAFVVIAYWWTTTRGTWAKWPAGRSLMGLLGIIAVGFGYGTINGLIGAVGYPAKPYIGFALYLFFIGSILLIGATIRKEMILGRAKANPPVAADPPVAVVDITVATTIEKADTP